MPQFKVGDRVYRPIDGVGVYVVNGTSAVNCIVVNDIVFQVDGRIFKNSAAPQIFQATTENQAALELLYGVKFDDAPKPVPVGSDLTRWLLAKYGKPVLCYVSDRSDDAAVDGVSERLVGRLSGSGWFLVTNGAEWRYAVPLPNATSLTTAADYVAD